MQVLMVLIVLHMIRIVEDSAAVLCNDTAGLVHDTLTILVERVYDVQVSLHVFNLMGRQSTSFKKSNALGIFLSLTHHYGLLLLVEEVHVAGVLQVIEVIVIIIVDLVISEIVT